MNRWSMVAFCTVIFLSALLVGIDIGRQLPSYLVNEIVIVITGLGMLVFVVDMITSLGEVVRKWYR
jgi:hypothetical protein